MKNSILNLLVPCLLGAAPCAKAAISLTNLQLWMKADAITGLNNGDAVGTWLDSSGNNRNASQSGSLRPTFITGAVNGLPVLRFDGADDHMDVADNSVWALSNFTIYAVVKIDTTAAQWWTKSWLAQDAGGGPNNKWMWTYDANGQTQIWHVNAPGNGSAVVGGSAWTPASNQYYLLEVNKSGSNYSFFQNGGANGTATNSLSIPDVSAPLTIGMAEGGTFDGDIAELLIYNAALDNTDRNNVGRYLGDKYGLNVSYVPEPCGVILMLVGLGTLLFRQRRKACMRC